MAYLLILLAALLLPYGGWVVAKQLGWGWASAITPALAGCSGLALIFLLAGIAHFLVTRPMAEMIPPAIPYRVPLVYFTGLCELAAVAGLLLPEMRRTTGWAVIVFLIAVFPANISGALRHLPLGGHDAPHYLWFRVPVQLFLIGWTYYFAVRQAGV